VILALAPFALLALCGLPWLLVLSRRYGSTLAVLVVLAAALALVLGVFSATPLLGLDPVIVVLTVAVAVGIVGALALRRDPVHGRPPAASTRARWIGASLGGAAWIATIAIAQLVPDSNRLSWAMSGDGANNIHLVRMLQESRGLTPEFLNSVPLANELQALAFWPGRDSTSKSALLEHDLVAFGAFWALAIAVTGLLLGLVTASLVESRRPAVVAIAAAGGSLLATTWFFSGLPIESGYSNVHVALPVALASWLAFLRSRERPRLSAALLLGFGFAILAIWTPLVVIPISLLAAIGVRNWSQVREARPQSVLLFAAAAAPLLTWLLLESLPALRSAGQWLSTAGHGFPFTGVLLGIVVVVLVPSALLLRRRRVSEPLVDGVLALVVSSILGIAFLIYATHTTEQPWLGYYPTKYIWLLTVLLGSIALSLVVRLAADMGSPRIALATVAGVCVAALAASTAGPAPQRDDFVIEQPLQRIISGTVWARGDGAVRTILANTADDRSVVLWDSGDPAEAFINFWLLDFNGSGVNGSNVLREFTVRGYRELRDRGSYAVPSLDTLCLVIGELPTPATVYTTDPQLESHLEAQCPGADAVIVVGTAPYRE